MPMHDALIYVSLLVALYFESFMLVTFLSSPARKKRVGTALTAGTEPSVAIIVPCWNEEATVGGTVDSLLALDYPADKLSIILVNDGSTDNTPTILDKYATHTQVTALHKKENGGKYTAMNLGLAHARNADFIGFLDADSFAAPDALREMLTAFDDKRIAAVTASMSIHKPRTVLQWMQYAEYSFSIILRHVFATVNGLYVAPGPFSFYRCSALVELGPFKHAYLAEDMEMAMRAQLAGFLIGNALRARVYTKGPATLGKLLKQRTRWTTGFLRNLLFDYRDLIGNRNSAALGFFVLPSALIAIVTSITLFGIMLTQASQNTFKTLAIVQAAPLPYALSYAGTIQAPITATVFIASVLVLGMLVWMVMGKWLSRSPGRLLPGMVAYILLYSAIAPLWLIRSVAEVMLGTRTVWR